MDERFREILINKAELVSSFPAWMLSRETVERIRAAAKPAIIEVAGRDSIAAALRAAAANGYDLFLPSIAYTGTEFGDWRTAFEKVTFLAERLGASGTGAEVLPPVALGAPELWRALCGRYLLALYRRFGFHTPCVGCHLYLHAIRIPLAKKTDCRVVVGGERESHNDRVKLNQIPRALDAYVDFLGRFGVVLALPLRHVTSGAEVQELVGRGRRDGEEHVECVLSRNYLEHGGGLSYDEKAIGRFLEEFAFPLLERAINAYLAGRRPDYEKLADDLWPKS
ncbi:MAG: hypothetical protein GTN49_01990 [candidate division Zixibacteria bacterium]|nr:hypothetical protein [candidate division Zixibacteria bacterium]